MNPIKLLFSGDFAPLVSVEKIGEYHFEDLSEIFSLSDLHITNLEAPLTSSQKPIEKTGPSIKADPSTIALLKQAKVNIACLANNHVYDYGENGITDTIESCKKNGIETIGIVNRTDKFSHWIIKEIKGKKIAFLNYCEHEFSVREPELLGANGYSAIDSFYDIVKLRSRVDFIIVIYHGGNEFYNLPSPELKKVFHYFIDIGADAVIGHHTHVFSGYEIYKGKPLVYSLGNFFFPYKNEPLEWHKGILCELEIGETISFRVIPILQTFNNCRIDISSNHLSDVNEKVEELSCIIKDDLILKENWRRFVSERNYAITNSFLFSSRPERLAAKLGLLKMNEKRRKRILAMLNILRCSSLNLLLKDSLKIKLEK